MALFAGLGEKYAARVGLQCAIFKVWLNQPTVWVQDRSATSSHVDRDPTRPR